MIFLQSRGRRESLERFFSLSMPSLDGRVLIDDDDPSYDGMSLPDNWEFFSAPRASSSEILNRAFKKWPDDDFYGQIGDDYICTPVGWDGVLAKSAGITRISWGDDGRWGDKLCTSFFVGGELVRTFGWFAHPELKHLYVDSIWWMIAKGAGIGVYRPDISVKHINVKDQTYRERRIGDDHRTFSRLRGDAIGALIEIAAMIKI